MMLEVPFLATFPLRISSKLLKKGCLENFQLSNSILLSSYVPSSILDVREISVNETEESLPLGSLLFGGHR